MREYFLPIFAIDIKARTNPWKSITGDVPNWNFLNIYKGLELF